MFDRDRRFVLLRSFNNGYRAVGSIAAGAANNS
jgi:hypothetical protein